MKSAIVAAALILATGSAYAQTTPGNRDTKTPAIATSTTVNPAAPVPGANSFTEAQAKGRIEAAGYNEVSALTKDKDGVWHGEASKAGATHTVSLDYQGNVTAD
jgi:hypothetical protein